MTRIHIRSYHLDGYGHVNNARYLEFLEEARWAFFEQHNLLRLLEGIMMVVARIDIRYLRAAQAGQTLTVSTRIQSAAPRQVMLRQTVSRADNGKTAAEADITLVPVSAATGRTAGLPAGLLAFLTEHTQAES